ncbi:MAG: PfkB family carbohydrate kinase [Chloroflexota bacterium]|mgnify:CR=1 FL=1
MSSVVPLETVDYLVIGHAARDLTPQGAHLGGTVAYAALTARALGLRVGIVTAAGADLSLEPLNGIPIVSIPSQNSTTYENLYTETGRIQYLRARAERIPLDRVPAAWRSAPILHLAPIADEVDAILPDGFAPTLLGLTPQGWMRQWDSDGRVFPRQWLNAEPALARADAVVLSREDVNGDDLLIEHMAEHTKILVVTEGAAGAVLYWHGDRRRFRAPSVREVDATGAGDIFAAAFFFRYLTTRDPWEATRFATLLASHSVEREGLAGIPTRLEIEQSMMVVIP